MLELRLFVTIDAIHLASFRVIICMVLSIGIVVCEQKHANLCAANVDISWAHQLPGHAVFAFATHSVPVCALAVTHAVLQGRRCIAHHSKYMTRTHHRKRHTKSPTR